MTILLTLPSTPKLVIFSGDRRLSDSKGISDKNQKATRLGQNGVGGVTGRTRVTSKETGEPLRDAHAWCREFFDGRDVSPETIDEYGQFLRQKYQEYLDKHKGGKEQPGVNCCLFTTVMTYFFQDRLLKSAVEAMVTTEDGLHASSRTSSVLKCQLIPAGDPNIITPLITFSSPELEPISSQTDIRELLDFRSGLPFGAVGEARAIEICRFVNRVCSDKYHAVTGNESTISPDCDVLILDPAGVRTA